MSIFEWRRAVIIFDRSDELYAGPDPSKTLAGRLLRAICYVNRRGHEVEVISLKEGRYLDFITRYRTDKLASPFGWTVVRRRKS